MARGVRKKMARVQRRNGPQDGFPVQVDQDLYPPPDYRFPNVKIGLTAQESKPDFPPPPRAPPGAPNVLLVLLDDVGYGWMNTFGGLIGSPTLDRLAKRGLRYCQFHTTALCSPTRAALLTGRNHHTVATGCIQELATGYPGYCGLIPKSCATVAETLKQNGYAAGWWGKNHNVPDNQTSAAGPFDRWPTHLGFDHFYGFIGGETDQFYPALYRGTTPVDPPRAPEQGYQLTRQWTKQVASHFGGTRNGLVISWPARIADRGGKRFQFHHVIDIAPTLLEVAGIAEPAMVNGAPQHPIEGVSMAYSFADAGAPSRRTIQYFEMFGNRALYADGWIASCMHGRLPWIMSGLFPFGPNERWELYDIARDFSQSEDLAAKHPEKLRELRDLFMAEAGKYNVLPLDDRGAERMDVTLRPSFFYGRRKVALPGDMVRLPEGSAPKTCNVSYSLTVSAEIPKGGADGVLVCIGGDSGGWTLFVRDGRLVYHYNWFDIERYEVTSTERLPAGEVELSLDFRNESDKPGGPASVRLFVDGKPCGDLKLPKQVPGRFSVESLDVGVDKMSPVCKGYPRKQGFAFTGKIHGVTFEFEGAGAELSLEERHEQALRME